MDPNSNAIGKFNTTNSQNINQYLRLPYAGDDNSESDLSESDSAEGKIGEEEEKSSSKGKSHGDTSS